MAGESRDQGVANNIFELIVDILKDLRKLVSQEIRLAKHEFRQAVRKILTILLSVTVGIALALIAGLLLVFMLVHLINALTELPLWACYGIVAGVFTTIGIMLVTLGIKGLKKLHLIPARTIHTVKENARWLKEIAISSRM